MSRHNVPSLRDQVVVITGAVRDGDGKHHSQQHWARRARRQGAKVADDFAAATTLVVQGELTGNLADTKRGYSRKLVAAEEGRRTGPCVHVVTADGFLDLLAGRPALCRKLQRPRSGSGVYVKAEGGDDVFGAVIHTRPVAQTADSGRLAVDLAKLDAGRAAHQRTLNKLVKHLGGIEARLPSWGQPQFDAGWINGGKHWIAEVKGLGGADESQQVRLGIGQLLDYGHQLRPKKVQLALVLERRPEDGRWPDLCHRHGIVLTWGPDFPGV